MSGTDETSSSSLACWSAQRDQRCRDSQLRDRSGPAAGHTRRPQEGRGVPRTYISRACTLSSPSLLALTSHGSKAAD